MDDALQLTSALMWRATVIAAAIDVPLLALVARAVSPAAFRALKWYLVAAAVLVYGALWGAFGAVMFWDTVYGHIFPAWFRWPLPAVYGALYGAVALLFWRIAVTAPRRPGLWFCVLGGLVSLVGHGIGISRGLLRVPLLSQVSAVSALVFGVFEFIVYWGAIIAIAAALRTMMYRAHSSGVGSASGV
jgi:hypothetical protein